MDAKSNMYDLISSSLGNPEYLRGLIPEAEASDDRINLVKHMLRSAALGGYMESYRLARDEYAAALSDETDRKWATVLMRDLIETKERDDIAKDFIKYHMVPLGPRRRRTFSEALDAAVGVEHIAFVRWIMSVTFNEAKTMGKGIQRACQVGNRQIMLLLIQRIRNWLRPNWGKSIGDEPGALQLRDQVIALGVMLDTALRDPEIANNQGQTHQPLMVLLLLPVYARCAAWWGLHVDTRQHEATMQALRFIFDTRHFADEVPASDKFGTYSLDDCYIVMNILAPKMSYLLAEALSTYLRSEKLAPFDVRITVEGETFAAHLFMVRAWSPYLKRLFDDRWSGQTHVTLDGEVSKDLFKEVLDFMYTGKYTIKSQTKDHLRTVGNVAKKWEMLRLWDHISSALWKMENPT
ncbi:hypothetical protein BJY01DRAFT_247855 [Aspergillus pseudoustus]|uniref:BTB domain-containing protein n=1 Tax=Aspergillus pseudoustus TaxID=1810923 RepID=A0ABR4JY97_9EURO